MGNKKSFLDSESRVSAVMGTAWQLIGLNILVLVCCLPVITAGDAVTAMHYVLLKIVRKEDAYLVRDFFHSFKENIGQAVILWLIKLAFLIPLGIQVMLLRSGEKLWWPGWVSWLVLIAGFMLLVLLAFVFPLQSHFTNTVSGTLENSFRLGLAGFPRAFVMAFIWVLPLYLLLHVLAVFPLVLLLGFSLPGYICCRLYEPVFKRLEQGDGETEE